MRKLLIYWVSGASLAISGCSTVDKVGSYIPKALENTFLMYKIDVQQGNVIDQEMVNSLKPGMSKSQVRYVMGTPILVDVFHQDRWDYLYSMKKAAVQKEKRRVTLYFKDDRLERLEGDIKPQPPEDITTAREAAVYEVPDYEGKKGIFTRAFEAVGLEDEVPVD